MRDQIVIKSIPDRIVYGVVYSPWLVDTDGEAMLPSEIEKAAHEFMAANRATCIDIEHNMAPCGCVVVDSVIADAECVDYKPGTWIISVKVLDDATGKMIERGELNAFSLWGATTRTRYPVLIAQPVSGNGWTETSIEGSVAAHAHEVHIRFGEDARIVPADTEEALGHAHRITSTTVTDSAIGHVHKLILDPTNTPDNSTPLQDGD